MQNRYLDALESYSMLVLGAGIKGLDDKLDDVTGLQLLHILDLQPSSAQQLKLHILQCEYYTQCNVVAVT